MADDAALPPYDGTELLSIIRMLPDVVFRCVKGPDGRIYWTLNEGRLAEEFHLTTAEIQGKSLDELFPGGASSELRKHFEDAFAGRPSVFINEIGGRFFKHFPQPVFGPDGKVEAVVGFISEVTESVQAQALIKELNGEMMKRVVELNAANDDLQAANEELARANRDLDAFAHTVSHDLRAPLTVIQNVAHVLRLRHKDGLGPKGMESVERIQRAGARMDDLIQDILRFSRANRQPLQKTDVDVSALVHEIADTLRLQDPARDVRWEIEDGVHVHADPGLLRNAMENLLGNAWKYTGQRESATISFSVAQVEGKPRLVVADDGIGFAPEEADRLFQAFSRLEGGKVFAGNGVGLATVKRIVDRHGGGIEATGAVGKGARFSLWLPPPGS